MRKMVMTVVAVAVLAGGSSAIARTDGVEITKTGFNDRLAHDRRRRLGELEELRHRRARRDCRRHDLQAQPRAGSELVVHVRQRGDVHLQGSDDAGRTPSRAS